MARWAPNQEGPHGGPTQSLVIVVEEGLAVFGYESLVIYWGFYEGTRWAISSWTKRVIGFTTIIGT